MKDIKDVVFIIQARTQSTRVPNKMLRPFASSNLFEIAIKKVLSSNLIPKDKEVQANINVLSEENLRIRILAKTTQDQTDETINDSIIEPLELIADRIMNRLYFDSDIKDAINPRYRIEPLIKIYY